MVQDVVYAAYRWVIGGTFWLVKLAPIALLALGVLGVLWLILKSLDPERAERWATYVSANRSGIFRLAGLAFVTTVLCGLLVQGQKITTVRQQTIVGASASRRNEPNLSGVVQFAPSVGVVEEKTYTRRLTLPPDFLTRIGEGGVQVLSPYLVDPSTENVLRLVDSFRRSGQDVVFTREVTRLDETAIPADSADVKVDLHSLGGASGRRHFSADFAATFRFHNPRPTEQQLRFVFPLPEGSGTIEGFSLETAGQRVTEPDEKGVYAWQGLVPAGAGVQVVAHYKFTGAGSFDYRLGSERRRIGDFNFIATSDQLPKFGKAGIFPSNISGNRAEWHLKDVLTYQSVEIVLPRVDLQGELLDKTLTLLPVALALFSMGALWCGSTRAIAASVAFGLGLLAIPILAAYSAPAICAPVGGLLAALGGGFVLGSRKGWIVAVLCGALALAFLTVEHAGLVAWVLAVMAALALGRRPRAVAA